MASSTTVVHQTLTNLQAAYEGESNACAKYTAFAVKADQEGFRDIASLFRAAARAEQIHAENQARVIRTLGAEPTCTIHAVVPGTTRDNLLTAIEGEEYERDVMYPGFITEAIASNEKGAVRTFKWALEVEAEHAKLYRAALDNLGTGRPQVGDYVCVICGFTTADGTWPAA